MHSGKNMMLWEWCHRHSKGANHKSPFMIGSSNLNHDSVVAYEKSSFCVTMCVCVCMRVCVTVSLCVQSFSL